MQDDIAVLSAERSIREVIAKYARGVDRRDQALVRSVYHDDCEEDHGDGFSGGPDEFVAWAMKHLQNFVGTQHFMGQSMIALAPDRLSADVETYCVGRHLFPVNGESQQIEEIGVRYVDGFENRPGVGWRVARRTVVVEWRAQRECTALDTWHRSFTRGQRDRSDISYTGLLGTV
jgi:hypothetical protein